MVKILASILAYLAGLGLLLLSRPCWPLMFGDLCGIPQAEPWGLALLGLSPVLLFLGIREVRRAA